MVSRMKDDPEALIAGREKLIERKVEERGRAQDAVKSAHVLLALPEGGPNVVHASIPRPPDGTLTIPERWKAAKWLDELERDHEPFATIKKAEEKLHKAIEAGREKIESPTDAIQTLKDELKQIEADHHDHFRKRAEEGSRSGDAQRDKLLAVFDETTQALGDMWSRWTRVNTPISTRGDLGHIRRELEEVRKGCCWPGHTEANYRESQQAPPPAPKLTNREARVRFMEAAG